MIDGKTKAPVLKSLKVTPHPYTDGPGVNLMVEFDLPDTDLKDIRAISIRCNGITICGWRDLTKRTYTDTFRSNGGAFYVKIQMEDHCGNLVFSNEMVKRIPYQAGPTK